MSVQRALGRPLDALELHSKLVAGHHKSDALARLRYLPRRFTRSHPGLFRHAAVQWALGGSRLARDSNAIYDAVTSATGRPYCVDSSKSVFRFRAIHGADAARTRAIVIARDFRGVVHSKMRRGESLESAAAGWARTMRQIDVLTQDLKDDVVMRVKYEDLCDDPERELRKVCAFLEIEFSPVMLERPVDAVHHIGGSPSKFDNERTTIRLDRSHEHAFTKEELARMKRITAASALRWGY
jgi:hypothetical protein